MDFDDLDDLQAGISWAGINAFGLLFEYSMKQMRKKNKKPQDAEECETQDTTEEMFE